MCLPKKEAMNQQQFSNSPENSSNAQPIVNPDPREWGPGQEGGNQDYSAGYAFGNQGGGKVYPTSRQRRPRRRHRFMWIWIVLLVCLILGMLSGLNDSTGTHTALPTRTFLMANEPKLVVTDELGTVNIHTGGNGSVVVAGTQNGGFFGQSNDIQVDVTPHGNNELDITVQSGQGWDLLHSGSVDLDITVPALSDINVTSNAGSMNIDGVIGQMILHADAGTINVRDSTLKGSSTLEANAGSINYSGSLATDSTSNFQADAGSINLTLPSDSSFKLDANVNAGSVNNDFNSDTVGNAPFAQIIAHSDAGSVNIHKK
jgi:hypothetical protein